MKTHSLALFGLLVIVGPFTATAQTTAITYQGRITDHGTNFTGPGQFKFALVTSTNNNHQATAAAVVTSGFVTGITVMYGGNGYVTPPGVTVTGGGGLGATATATLSSGVVTSVSVNNAGSGYTNTPTVTLAPPQASIVYTSYWSNDGTSAGGSEPAAVVNVPVAGGLFTVAPGDAAQPGMAPIDASVFGQPNLQLRIWFNDGVSGSAVLDPVQNLTPAPYAVVAQSANGLPGLTVQQNTSGAPNLIGGAPGNFVSGGVLGATISGGGATNFIGSGYTNSVTGTFGTVGGGGQNSAAAYATVSGGVANIASGAESTVGGGSHNIASGFLSTVGGGSANVASGSSSIVGGGSQNSANNYNATVAGGNLNTASAAGSFIGGGGVDGSIFFQNTAGGGGSVIGGGVANTTLGFDSVVAGGRDNHATNDYAMSPGGAFNYAGGRFSFAAGLQAQALHDGAFVWADAQSAWFASTAPNQFNIRANGGVRLNDDTRMSFGATTRQMLNLWNNSYGIGVQSYRLYFRADNGAGFAWFSGGSHTNTMDNAGTGGTELMNLAPSGQLTVFGTSGNGVEGHSTSSGTSAVYGQSDGSGYGVSGRSTGTGTAVFGDNANASGWAGYFNGNVRVTGTINPTSDRNAKQDFQPVEGRAVLSKVAAMPIQTWAYKADASRRHIGPVAQDFHAAFGLNGPDDKTIATVDADGVALAAIQGLNQKVDEQLKAKDREIEELKQSVAELKELVRRQAR